jgi:hypothetical protein
LRTERKLRKGRLIETAAAEEIKSDAFGNFFLMISTSCLEKPSGKTLLGFPTVTTSPTAIKSI